MILQKSFYYNVLMLKKHLFLLPMLKIVLLPNIFLETDYIFFTGFFTLRRNGSI